MNSKISLYLAVTTTISAVAATLSAFFIAKHFFSKKADMISYQIPLQKNEIISNDIDPTNSIKNDLIPLGKKEKININDLYDENNQRIQKFNKTLLSSQKKYLIDCHQKNQEIILDYILNSKTIDSNKKVLYKANETPFQNLIIENYYETNSNNIKTIFLPINDSNEFNGLVQKTKNNLYKKITPLKNINFGTKLNKTNSEKIKQTIDAYCFHKQYKYNVKKALKYACENDVEIAGFFISEYQRSNNINDYTINALYSY